MPSAGSRARPTMASSAILMHISSPTSINRIINNTRTNPNLETTYCPIHNSRRTTVLSTTTLLRWSTKVTEATWWMISIPSEWTADVPQNSSSKLNGRRIPMSFSTATFLHPSRRTCANSSERDATVITRTVTIAKCVTHCRARI